MNALDFFSEFFDSADTNLAAEQKISIWTPHEGNRQFESAASAAKYALGLKGDVYFGLGTTSKSIAPNHRPVVADIQAIYGFWADVDIEGPESVHKADKLPPSREEALDVLGQAIPLDPSVVVDSGYGMHVYWLFKEPWIFESEKEHEEAMVACRKFVLSIKYHFALRGWRIDSVFDMTRILRVPGTSNCKIEDNKIACKIISSNDKRYNADEFEKYHVNDDSANTNESISAMLSKDKNPLGLFLSANASPPFEKFENIISNESRFRKSWNKERPDLKDQSMSEYELSLASFCVSYSWTDQEIANVLISFRRKFASEKKFRKCLRIDYITRTILRARKQFRGASTESGVEKIVERITPKATDQSEASPSKDEISSALENLLKVRISRIVKIVTDIPQFEIHFEDGTVISAGGIETIINQAKLRCLLAAHKGVLPTMVKARAWDDYAMLLLQLVEEVRASRESTAKGALLESIRQYLEEVGIVQQWVHACKIKRPFVKDGKIYIFSSVYTAWAKIYTDKITTKELAIEFASLGVKAEPMKFNMGTEENPKYTTRSVYDVTKFSKDVFPNEIPGLTETENC